jgi:protein-disulfide isomerase
MEHDPNHQPEAFEQTHMASKAPKRDYFLPMSILVAGVIIAGAVVFASYRGSPASLAAGGVAQNNNQPAAAQPSVNAADIMKLGSRDAVLGSANAPVTIIEYGDYQCPFCTKFFSQTQSLIVANYVNTGKAKFVFRNLAFLGPESTAAAQAAECANDQGKLWAYHDALYKAKIADENAGGSENDGYFTRAVFLKLAGQVGLDATAFASCVDGNKYATLVAQEKSDTSAIGVNSTPTFFVNGQEIQGAQPYASFQTALNTAGK